MTDIYQARDLPDDLLRALIKIHQCYRNIQKRLTYFRSINVLWPECTSKLLGIGAEDRKQEVGITTLDLSYCQTNKKSTVLRNLKQLIKDSYSIQIMLRSTYLDQWPC